MATRRTLVVRRERLAELTTDDLIRVAGGESPTIAVCGTLKDCFTETVCTTFPSCTCPVTTIC